MAFDTGEKAAAINVTPLIDILLVLLITFLLITPITPQGEEARIPRKARTDRPVGPEGAVVLQLARVPGSSESVQLAINRQRLEWGALNATLRQVFKTRADKTLFLAGEKEIDFRYVAQAVDAAHAAGVDNVGLMTTPKR